MIAPPRVERDNELSALAVVQWLLNFRRPTKAQYDAAINACRQVDLYELAGLIYQRQVCRLAGCSSDVTVGDIERFCQRVEREVANA